MKMKNMLLALEMGFSNQNVMQVQVLLEELQLIIEEEP